MCSIPDKFLDISMALLTQYFEIIYKEQLHTMMVVGDMVNI